MSLDYTVGRMNDLADDMYGADFKSGATDQDDEPQVDAMTLLTNPAILAIAAAGAVAIIMGGDS